MRALVGIATLVLLVLGVDVLAMTSSAQTIVVRVWPFSGSFAVTPIVAVLFGAGIAVCAVIFWTIVRPAIQNDYTAPPAPRVIIKIGSDLVIATGIVVVVTSGAMLILGMVAGKIEPLIGICVYAMGWLSVIATLRAIRDLDRFEGIAFDSYWGGLGGAQGGWRVSPTTVSLVLALVLIAGTVAVATGKGPTAAPAKQDSAATNTADGDDESSDNAAAGNAK